MQITFATNNKNKLKEIQNLVPERFIINSLDDIGCKEEIPETGNTLKANASQKSHYILKKYQEDCFSDDTGLEIDALNGEPGVYSARYAGPRRNSNHNMDKVLENLNTIENRAARFKTVISLILEGKEYFFEGVCEGVITKEKSGTDGFGYDPIFMPIGFDRTFAEMTIEEKGIISHRGKAIAKLVDFLEML